MATIESEIISQKLLRTALEGLGKTFARKSGDKPEIIAFRNKINMLLSQPRVLPTQAADLLHRTDNTLLVHVRTEVDRLLRDIEYLAVIEKSSAKPGAGCEAVNALVSENLQQLKSTTDQSERERIIETLNDLFQRAIYLFPNIADGIQATLVPDAAERSEGFHEKFGYDYDRHIYQRYASLAKSEQTIEPSSLIVPLPFYFTTGTHGSGERSAMAASSDHLWMTMIHPRKSDEQVPSLAIEIEAPLIVRKLSHFTLDEVKSLRFISTDSFTPWYREVQGKPQFRERMNPVLHYLDFRQFQSSAFSRKRDQFRDFSDGEWDSCQKELWEARPFTALWREDYARKTKTLRRGFLARISDDPNQVRLAEFSDLTQPVSVSSEEQAARLFVSAFLRNNEDSYDAMYDGRGAIARLCQIPVDKRSF